MKKRLIVGDMHGMFGIIKDIYDFEQPDEFIILGDYFDSFNLAPEIQKLAYQDLLDLRKYHKSLHKGKFIMLLGNHDMHYLTAYRGQCSGYNKDTAWFASDFVSNGIDDGTLVISYIDKVNKTIFSHAGVTMSWFSKWCEGSLENINTREYKAFEFVGADWFGNDKRNSPIWVRPEALESDPYIDNNGYVWNQIFGHTHRNKPIIWNNNNSIFIGIDCITTYYIVEELDNKGRLVNRDIKENNNIVM